VVLFRVFFTPRYSAILAFQTLGTSATASEPSTSALSISKRRIMCSGYLRREKGVGFRERYGGGV